jgi:hypothetical protein
MASNSADSTAPSSKRWARPAGEVIQESYDAGDDLTRRIWDSYLASRADTMRFLRFNEQAFLNARTPEFQFPGPQAT